MVVKPVDLDGDSLHDDHLHFFNSNNLLFFGDALDEVLGQATLPFCSAQVEMALQDLQSVGPLHEKSGANSSID